MPLVVPPPDSTSEKSGSISLSAGNSEAGDLSFEQLRSGCSRLATKWHERLSRSTSDEFQSWLMREYHIGRSDADSEVIQGEAIFTTVLLA